MMASVKFYGFACVALYFCMATPVRAASTPLGMVLQASTESQLQREGQTTSLRMAEILYVGDRLVASAGEIAFLFCPTNEMIWLSDGDIVELNVDTVRSIEGGAPNRRARRCNLPTVALGAESLERVGGLRARGFPPIPVYLGGAVSTSRPTFEWAPAEGQPVYSVTLKNRFGRVVWQVETNETTLPYPTPQEALEPGSYLWEVTAEADGELVGQQSARFDIKPNPELHAEKPEEPAERLLRALELEEAGYYSEAAAYYRTFRRETPDDIRLTRRLVWLYWNSGLIAAANAERKQLDGAEKP